ncbi:ABC-2 family transporter protein [Treponema pedis]|nr:ABC-2 family transporter protein [Treponema pedis]
MISYYLITTLLINAYPFRHIALQIEEDVINGTIANYLIRPCDYSVYMFSKYLAWNLIYLIIFIPALIFVYFYNRIAMVNIIYFVFAVLLTKFIEFMTWYNIGLISLFIEKIKGIIITISAFMLFLSGNLIPLIFFPKWLENITLFFPFRIYIYFPASILLNKYDADYFLYNILQSLLWGFCFIVLSKLLWNSGMKKLETNIS